MPVVAVKVVVVLVEFGEPASGERIPVAKSVPIGATARTISNPTKSFRFTGNSLQGYFTEERFLLSALLLGS